jgi:hypothetical protein
VGSGSGRQAGGRADACGVAEAPKQDYEVVFLQNFFDELRRRVLTGKGRRSIGSLPITAGSETR